MRRVVSVVHEQLLPLAQRPPAHEQQPRVASSSRAAAKAIITSPAQRLVRHRAREAAAPPLRRPAERRLQHVGELIVGGGGGAGAGPGLSELLWTGCAAERAGVVW
eukprot:COSAG01_NODE_2381_length_7792_cov_5.907578_8_plen_106_part_00